MSYTALQKMREYNKNRFGKDVGPFEPDKFFVPGGNMWGIRVFRHGLIRRSYLNCYSCLRVINIFLFTHESSPNCIYGLWKHLVYLLV